MPQADVHNAYPDLPVLPYVHTTVAMSDVVNYISAKTVSVPVKRGAYVIFRNESGGGQDGTNNNYIGLQADGDRRPENWTSSFIGTCLKVDSKGDLRRFLCFKDWMSCADIGLEAVSSRGLYVGGYAQPYAKKYINTVDDWPLAYWQEWVAGSDTATIEEANKNDLLREYGDAVRYFPSVGFVDYIRNLGRKLFAGA
jgi:hypothetical protein